MADANLTVEHCMEMAAYLNREHESLQNLDSEAFYEGRIPWGPVPSWAGIKSLVNESEPYVAERPHPPP